MPRIECETRPGCMWNPGSIIPLEDVFPTDQYVYASICYADIPIEYYCNGEEPIVIYQEDCLFEVQCPFDEESFVLELPTKTYKANMYLQDINDFYIVEVCGFCENGYLNGSFVEVSEEFYSLPEDADFLSNYVFLPCLIPNYVFNDTEIENRTIDETNVLSIYPNPSSQDLIEISSDYTIMNVTLTNIQGIQVLQEQTIESTSYMLNVKNVISGIYYIRVQIGQEVYVQKLIII